VVPIAETFSCHATGETVEIETSSMLQSFFEVTDSVGVSKECVRRWLMYFARAAGISRPDIERTFNREPETLPDLIAHDCRASWCAQCLRCDVNRYTVRDWGGWSDMSMINRYAKFVGDPSGRQIAKF
jgi:bacterioferritin-associated ferredoxin